MLLKNKKTGEIGNLKPYGGDEKIWVWIDNKSKPEYRYNSLAELVSEWEDYEEPAYYYFIHDDGRIGCDAIDPYNHKSKVEERKSIGNYFETREAAEKAVEKLKTYKRLKDTGFRVNNWVYALEGNRENGSIPIEIKAECKVKTHRKDLDLLFCTEEK